MSETNKDTFFDTTEVSEKIKVQKPYFSFQQLWQEEDALIGTFVAEQPLIYETGPISAGELGRHMAILGSCTAVALHNSPEGYYLAKTAHFTRKNHELQIHQGTEKLFYASAKVLSIDKRSLKVSALVWNSEPVAELICEYTILTPALFNRNFRHYAKENLTDHQSSPYQNSIDIYNLTFRGMKLDAFAGPLAHDQCAGHFFGYPCWPVAIISQTAFKVTGKFLEEKYGLGTRFSVQETQLSAEKLIGADSALRFSVEILPQSNASIIKSIISVYEEDELVAHLTNQIQIIMERMEP